MIYSKSVQNHNFSRNCDEYVKLPDCTKNKYTLWGESKSPWEFDDSQPEQF